MKKKMGRPVKYNRDYCEMLIKHMGEGYSFESFAAVIDVCRETLFDWANKYEDFSHAKKRAYDKNLLFWEKIGIDGAKGRIANFNATAYVFNKKNRHKWRDNPEMEISTDGKSISFKISEFTKPENE